MRAVLINRTTDSDEHNFFCHGLTLKCEKTCFEELLHLKNSPCLPASDNNSQFDLLFTGKMNGHYGSENATNIIFLSYSFQPVSGLTITEALSTVCRSNSVENAVYFLLLGPATVHND